MMGNAQLFNIIGSLKKYSKKIIVSSMLMLLVITPNLCRAESPMVNLDFVQEDVGVVLQTLSEISGMNIIIDELAVKDSPKITIRLHDVSVEDALNLITQAKGLSYRKVGNTILVERADVAVTDSIKLQYANAEDAKKAITTVADGLKVKVDADDVSNSLVVSGSPIGIARLKALVAEIDKPMQQIELEAKVVEISKSGSKSLGMSWSWENTPQVYSSSTTGTTSDTNSSGTKGVITYGKSPSGAPYAFYYSATLNALVSKGDAKILSRPKITTVNGKEATIVVGDKIPVQTESTANGTTSTSTTYIDTGIKLDYTPVINADGEITAKVHTEVSTPILVSDIKAYEISTRQADTNVRMKDGDTMVIGGLIGSNVSKNSTSVPYLSSLPILGGLFRNHNDSDQENEIVIFLTAHILK